MTDKKAFENIVGKGENAGNQHFLLFLQCFHNVFHTSQHKFHFSVTFIWSSAYAFNLDKFKNLSFGQELIHYRSIPVCYYEGAYEDRTAPSMYHC